MICTGWTRRVPARALVAALLVAPAAGVRADDAAEPAPPPIAVGLDGGFGPVFHLETGERNYAPKFRASPFVRYGWAHLGAALEIDAYTRSLRQDDDDWLGPGETRIIRHQVVFASTLGASLPEGTLGDGWLGRHLRLELLGETGVIRTRLEEQLGANGVGDRTLRKSTPFVGARLGLRMRFGSPAAGSFGLAAFYRHPFDDERFRSANGRREPIAGDTVGVLIFGGADVTLRR